MPNVKLIYFDFDGGRGEDCRLALTIAGVDFVDERISFGQWSAVKPNTPFGSVPVLEIEGKGKLGQSNAILSFIGRGHDLHPKDSWEAAQHEAIMAAAEELRTEVGATLRLKDADEKRRIREELAEGLMQRWGANIEALLGEGPFVSGRLNVVDLKLFVLLKWFISGGVDHISKDVFQAFPKLVRVYTAVETHPAVAAYYAARPSAS